jgi:hypothetical protein
LVWCKPLLADPDSNAARSLNCCVLVCHTHRYPVPPMQETHARTEIIIGNWMQARNNRDKVSTRVACRVCCVVCVPTACGVRV